ncbi:MAG: hypothetical protein A2341_11860 [Deltaproteobacteria bacterium RIFOXYB12_FULL_58_9]|nr:MAG: hypothetical protein A2341_11860 [Deltaproteobacteria bacterium RIFOXYB12_FULL_58_9]
MHRDERVKATLRVELASDSDSAQPLGTTRDVSRTGLYLTTEYRWPIGSEMDVRIIHGNKGSEVTVQVARHDNNGVGLVFINLSESTRESITALIVDLLAQGAWFDHRRKALRAQIHGPISWAQDNTRVQSHLIDLSPKGARLRTGDPPAVGRQITIYMPSGDAEDLEACGWTALVAHSSGTNFGVTFLNPSQVFSDAVRRILTEGDL